MRPVGYMPVGTSEGQLVALHEYTARTAEEVGAKVLELARREGFTGTLDERLTELDWVIAPVYIDGPATDPERGTGRTTRQLMEAPPGAIYVCPHPAEASYTQALARHLHRTDLRIETPAFLHGNRWRGITLPVVLDHATKLVGDAALNYRVVRKPT